MAISIDLEASELLELFQWSGPDTDVSDRHDEMADELADVMIYCIYFAEGLGVDIPEIVASKLGKNAEKYPVEKSRGNSMKYTEL